MEIKIKLFVSICICIFNTNPAKSQDWIDNIQKQETELKVIRKKAKEGDGEALMKMYKYTRKEEYLKESAQRGYIPAIIKNGDIPQMREYAKKGYQEVMYNLAKSLFGKRKDCKDNEEAEKWFKKCLDKYPDGAYYIGQIYHNGWGKQKDEKEAYKWYSYAATHGIDKALEAAILLKPNGDLNSQTIRWDPIDSDIPKTGIHNPTSFAVIIGNGTYRDGSKITSAEHDGSIMKAYFINMLGLPAKNIRFIENATFNDMKISINWLSQILEAFEGEATCFVYFAGKGHIDLQRKTAMLMPVDANRDNKQLMYEVNEINQLLTEQPAKKIIIILDASFNGADREGHIDSNARGIAIKTQPLSKGRSITLLAASTEQTAYGYPAKNHGLFTYHLLKAMHDSQKALTLGELINSVQNAVSISSLKNNNHQQTPVIITELQTNEWENWVLW